MTESLCKTCATACTIDRETQVSTCASYIPMQTFVMDGKTVTMGEAAIIAHKDNVLAEALMTLGLVMKKPGESILVPKPVARRMMDLVEDLSIEGFSYQYQAPNYLIGSVVKGE